MLKTPDAAVSRLPLQTIYVSSLLLVAVTILVCCSQPPEKILFSFESVEELDSFHWRCGTLFSLSGEHATHGAKSLKLELFPSEYPGLAPMIKENDWRGYTRMSFDIFNPEGKGFMLSVRIDDREDYPEHDERYNAKIAIESGMNRVTIPFDQLVTSGTGRKLDLRNVYRLIIFMSQPQRATTIYLDHMRLEQ